MRRAEPAPADDRARVVTSAVLRAADALHIGKATLGRVLGLSPASVSRLAAGSPLRPGSKPYELALLLLRVYQSLGAIMGGDHGLAREWLESENRAVGERPIDRIVTITGLTEVAEQLDLFRART